MNTDNIDRFGHCVCCHKNLLTKRVVDGEVVDMFLPIFDETTFLLNNGSEMKVTICKPCKASHDLNDPTVHKNIMDAVQKGWQLENDILVADKENPGWDKAFGENYLKNQSALNINCHSEHLSKYVIQEKQMVILKKEVKHVSDSHT